MIRRVAIDWGLFVVLMPCVGSILIDAFRHPELTNTQLFLRNWLAIGLVCVLTGGYLWIVRRIVIDSNS